MATTQDYSVLSLYVYRVTNGTENFNRPQLPAGWSELELRTDNLLGFSYGVFCSPSGEIVLAYTGTNEGRDWWSNGFAGTGLLPSPQIAAAAKAYVDAIAAYGTNITLSGHSLGGGLASVAALWFDRAATVFDQAMIQSVVDRATNNQAPTVTAGGHFAMHSVAACACKQGVTGIFKGQNMRKSDRAKLARCHSSRQNTQTAHARFVWLVGHKWPGRRMDRAWAVSGAEVQS